MMEYKFDFLLHFSNFFDFFFIIQINASVSMSRYRKIIPMGVKYKQVDVRGWREPRKYKGFSVNDGIIERCRICLFL